jgi:hypothetical protein
MSAKQYPLRTCSNFPDARYVTTLDNSRVCTDIGDLAEYLAPLDDPKEEREAYSLASVVYDSRCDDFPDDMTKEEAERRILPCWRRWRCIHGVPLDVLRHALMRDAKGKPALPLGIVSDQLATETGQ